jgi:hypothetical protein
MTTEVLEPDTTQTRLVIGVGDSYAVGTMLAAGFDHDARFHFYAGDVLTDNAGHPRHDKQGRILHGPAYFKIKKADGSELEIARVGENTEHVKAKVHALVQALEKGEIPGAENGTDVRISLGGRNDQGGDKAAGKINWDNAKGSLTELSASPAIHKIWVQGGVPHPADTADEMNAGLAKNIEQWQSGFGGKVSYNHDFSQAAQIELTKFTSKDKSVKATTLIAGDGVHFQFPFYTANVIDPSHKFFTEPVTTPAPATAAITPIVKIAAKVEAAPLAPVPSKTAPPDFADIAKGYADGLVKLGAAFSALSDNDRVMRAFGALESGVKGQGLWVDARNQYDDGSLVLGPKTFMGQAFGGYQLTPAAIYKYSQDMVDPSAPGHLVFKSDPRFNIAKGGNPLIAQEVANFTRMGNNDHNLARNADGSLYMENGKPVELGQLMIRSLPQPAGYIYTDEKGTRLTYKEDQPDKAYPPFGVINDPPPKHKKGDFITNGSDAKTLYPDQKLKTEPIYTGIALGDLTNVKPEDLAKLGNVRDISITQLTNPGLYRQLVRGTVHVNIAELEKNLGRPASFDEKLNATVGWWYGGRRASVNLNGIGSDGGVKNANDYHDRALAALTYLERPAGSVEPAKAPLIAREAVPVGRALAFGPNMPKRPVDPQKGGALQGINTALHQPRRHQQSDRAWLKHSQRFGPDYLGGPHKPRRHDRHASLPESDPNRRSYARLYPNSQEVLADATPSAQRAKPLHPEPLAAARPTLA